MTKRKQFLTEFSDLLKKYDAEIQIDSGFDSYGTVDVGITIADSSLNSGDDFIALGNLSLIDGYAIDAID